MFLRVAFDALIIPIILSSRATWRLETVRARLKTKLDNLKAGDE